MIYSGRAPYGTNQIQSSSLAITIENTDVAVFTTGSLLVSGSLTSLGGFTGSFSGSFTGSANLTTLTSSNALITGNVTVLGTASINTLVINQTQLSTGSNQLGDNVDDFQTLFGTVRIPTGSLTVTGSIRQTASTASFGGLVNIGTTASRFNLTIPDYGRIGSDYVLDSYIQLGNAIGLIANYNVYTLKNLTVGAGDISARLGVKGSGTTSATTALLIQNANASSSLVVLDNGNVGIGTATPGAKLDVNGTTYLRGVALDGIFGYTGNNIAFSNTGNTTFVGNVGIGNTSPAARLHVKGAGSTSNSTGLLVENASSAPAFTVTDDLNARFYGNVGVRVTPSASLHIAGNTILSGSAGTGSALTVYKSGSTVMSIQGSQGELFSITDSLSGSLFSVSNISGLPILEVFSDNTVLLGSYLDPMLITTQRVTANSGSTVIYSLPTASYDGVFVDYVIRSGSNARAGQFMGLWSGSSTNYTDNSTTDFGSTTSFTFGLIISGSNMVLTGSVTTGSWTVRAGIRSI